MSKTVLVIGGTGMLGEPVARRLCTDGHHVRIFTRSLDKAQAKSSILGSQPHPWHWVAADDYARMVSKVYPTPGAANKTLHVFGPQPWTTRQALQTYCSIAHPDAKVGVVPFWMASIIAGVSRDKTLQAVLPFFRYSEKVAEAGDPAEANALLGAPAATLEQWCRLQVGRKSTD